MYDASQTAALSEPSSASTLSEASLPEDEIADGGDVFDQIFQGLASAKSSFCPTQGHHSQTVAAHWMSLERLLNAEDEASQIAPLAREYKEIYAHDWN